MNEEKEIMILGGKDKPEDLIKKFSEHQGTLSAKGYYNPTNGTRGILIFSEDNPTETIDVFMTESDPRV